MSEERNQAVEQKPEYHERLRTLRGWTVPSPKIDFFIVEGKLVESHSLTRSELETRPDLEVGIQPAEDLPIGGNNEESRPLSKDFSVSSSPSTVPEKTTKQVTDVMNIIATASLVKSYSQLNFGAEIRIYPRDVRRFYPEGIEQIGAPFTLPTHSEIVRVLLADNIKSKSPQEIKEEMKLKDDLRRVRLNDGYTDINLGLGMTGTSLKQFEDELEHYGFVRPGLDLTVQETVKDVIERLTKQRKVLESLTSTVFFPRTKKYFTAQRQIQAARKTTEMEGLPPQISWSQEYFHTLTGKYPEGPVKFSQVLGAPVYTCELDSDFQSLRPIEQRPIQPNTYAYSFVVTRLNRLYPQGETQDFPLIVVRTGTSDKDILQHARTQFAFARKVNPEKLTTVLVSNSPLGFDDDIRMKVRNYLLSILVSQTQPVDWYKDEEEGGEISKKRSQLFPSTADIFGKERPLYMGNWLSSTQKVFGRSEKEHIFDEVTKQMKKDIGAISRLIQIKPSVEFQVFIANYLSLFDDWEGVENTFQSWEYRNIFRDSFGATLPPSEETYHLYITNIFRDRAPQV